MFVNGTLSHVTRINDKQYFNNLSVSRIAMHNLET